MGTCYRLVREDLRETFDLDKGSWFDVFPRPNEKAPRYFAVLEIFSNEASLAVRIEQHAFYNFKGDLSVYSRDLARRIWSWCGDAPIRLIADCGDDGALGWPTTGDRFFPTYVVHPRVE